MSDICFFTLTGTVDAEPSALTTKTGSTWVQVHLTYAGAKTQSHYAVSFFHEAAQAVLVALHPGMHVLVSGRVSAREYQGKTYYDLSGDRFVELPKPAQPEMATYVTTPAPVSGPAAPTPVAPQAFPPSPAAPVQAVTAEDIPF